MDIDERYVTQRKSSRVSLKQQSSPSSSSSSSIDDDDDQVPPSLSVNKPRRRVTLKRRSMSSRCNLLFPVARFKRYLHEDRYAKKISPKSCVYLAAVLEYLSAEVLDISSEVAKQFKRTRINPRHITLAIRNDEELNRLLPNTTIVEGGVVPNILPFLVSSPKSPNKKSPKKGKSPNKDDDSVSSNGDRDTDNHNGNNNNNNNNDSDSSGSGNVVATSEEKPIKFSNSRIRFEYDDDDENSANKNNGIIVLKYIQVD
jgi:histone H2A